MSHSWIPTVCILAVYAVIYWRLNIWHQRAIRKIYAEHEEAVDKINRDHEERMVVIRKQYLAAGEKPEKTDKPS